MSKVKFNMEELKSQIISDKELTSRDDAIERFWTPQIQGYGSVIEIEVSKIIPDPNQPRKFFNKLTMEDLKNSIQERGVEQPILVREIHKGMHKIIAGERRWRCCCELNIKTIPAIIKTINDSEAYLSALTENIQREELHFLDEGRSFKNALDMKYAKDQADLARKIGKSKAYISRKISIGNLPETVKEIILNSYDAISLSHAEILVTVTDPDICLRFTKRIQKENLTVAALQRIVANWNTKKEAPIRNAFKAIHVMPVPNGFNLLIKYRKNRPEDITSIITVLKEKIEELKKI